MAYEAVHGDSQPAGVWPPWIKGCLEHLLCLPVLTLEGDWHRETFVDWEDTENSTRLYPLSISLALSDR